MFSLFRRRSPVLRPFRPPVLEVALVGRPHSGKTVMLDVLTGLPLEQPLPSALRIGIADPRQMALWIRRRRAAESELRRWVKVSSPAPASLTLSLFDGLRETAVLRFRDAPGQLLTHTLPNSSTSQQDLYDAYVAALAGADVLLGFIACPRNRATEDDVQRLREDVQLTCAYLREALRRRRPGRPCALGICVSRIDCRYRDVGDAQARMPREFSNWLAGQVRPLAALPGVGEICLFPLSSLGFDTAVEGPLPGWDEVTRGEPEWRLHRHARPFNLTTLLVWAFLVGLLHRRQEDFSPGELPSMTALCKTLRDDLEGLGGWRLPLKSG